MLTCPAELWPAEVRHQLVDDLLERDAVKRVVRLGAHFLLGGAVRRARRLPDASAFGRHERQSFGGAADVGV